MSGRKVEDKSSWIGKGNGTSVFPMGVKSQMRPEVTGAGDLGMKYPDTDEQIVANQKKIVSKINGQPMKEGYRN